MKFDFIFIMGTFVGIMFTLLFPTQVIGDDPTGLNGIRTDKIKQYISQDGSGYIKSYNEETGMIITSDNQMLELESIISATSGEKSSLVNTALGFPDYVRVGWNLLTTALRFTLAFIVICWSLPNPLNIALGLPMIFLYIFSAVSYFIGR